VNSLILAPLFYFPRSPPFPLVWPNPFLPVYPFHEGNPFFGRPGSPLFEALAKTPFWSLTPPGSLFPLPFPSNVLFEADLSFLAFCFEPPGVQLSFSWISCLLPSFSKSILTKRFFYLLTGGPPSFARPLFFHSVCLIRQLTHMNLTLPISSLPESPSAFLCFYDPPTNKPIKIVAYTILTRLILLSEPSKTRFVGGFFIFDFWRQVCCFLPFYFPLFGLGGPLLPK